MVATDSVKDLQAFLTEHAKMQLFCYNLSSNADHLGFPGFSHYFQVQGQDEVLHQRRIMNFMMQSDVHFQLDSLTLPEYKKYNNLKEIVEAYKEKRTYFAELTNKLAKEASTRNDLTTTKFYDWFIIDFSEELGEIKDLLDWIAMSNGDYYDLDKKVLKREEPNTLLVIEPFSPHK
ncbi:ferritin [Spiroplasma chrysopicola]|uniref:Ferritin-like diiron domain-containing protein n=1 Tax=Spiroplasma chrysopicola DF-1 TaxID=1276227 RepID=R4UFH1_9MOLU|nr:ferritin-like domain-containing protein [Spiroplasma chrysopicola]AGM24900.1 hypothetical protein SCHRY_v1c03150 [Spiroplasma chrysopicola DF-1]